MRLPDDVPRSDEGVPLPRNDNLHTNGNDKPAKNGVTLITGNGHGGNGRLPIDFVRAELVNAIRDNDTLIGRWQISFMVKF